MFGDQELDKLYTELQGLTSSSKPSNEKNSVFSFEEEDLNVLFDKKARHTAAPVAKQKKNSGINQDFVLGLSSHKPSASDKELTLGEYLQKYGEVEKVINKEQKNRSKYHGADYDKLINLVEENENQPVNNPFKMMHKEYSREMFISKKVENRIEAGQQNRESSSSKAKALFVGDIQRNKSVFSQTSRDERKPINNRIENFSNAKASLTHEKFMSPLSLERFNSKEA